MKIKNTLTAFTLMFVAAISTSKASADEYRHIDQLAVKITRKTDQLLRETVHYRNTPEYVHLVQDTQQMAQLAEHIHEVAHVSGDLAHLESDLRELDARFHHIEGLIDNIEEQAYYGCRIVRGKTAHVKRLLNSIEDCIHHIQDDVAQLRRSCALSRRTVRTTEVYTAPRVYQSRTIYTAPRTTTYYSTHRTRGNGYGSYGKQYSRHSSGYGHRDRDRDRVGCGNAGGVQFSIGGGSSQLTFRF